MTIATADLLLELFSEEIPARMQASAVMELASRLPAGLAKAGYTIENLRGSVFSSPRRIAVLFRDLPVEQAASSAELKGPKVGAPDAALQGFLKKNNLTQADLTERDGVYFAIATKAGQKTADTLKGVIEDVLATFPWPKSMRWGNGEQAWVRPLQSILCLFDGKVIPVSFAGITASNTTRGHRFLSPASITIAQVDDYEALLEKAHVIADRDKRKAIILEQAEKAAKAAGLSLKKDEGLLEEVTGLVEWPVVLTGTIDAGFMDLPKEVLVSEMRAHQKYFALEKADGSLADKFLITANMPATDGGKAIIAGNERVLRARLADGRFFWDQDRKKPLSEWAKGLESVTFHAKLGTIADKVSRIEKLALRLAEYVKADTQLVQQAARLCKADLVTGMVGEFPELQGVMGRYYATAQKEPQAVADAIRDHYKPQGPSDSVPTDPVGICVALADKLDTLVSMFAIGEKPTGSKDPFALRRSALGIIRIVLENKLRLSIPDIVFDHSGAILSSLVSSQAAKVHIGVKALRDENPHAIIKNQGVSMVMSPVEESQGMMEFFIERLKVQLKDSGVRHDVINAIVANRDYDLVRIVERAKAVQAFIDTPEGDSLLAAFKRAQNIVKDVKITNPYIEANLFDKNAERALLEVLDTTRDEEDALLKKEDYTAVMRLLARFRAPVDAFFDTVMVNDTNDNIRQNRQNLLIALTERMKKVADFGLIQSDSKDQRKVA